MIVAFPGYLNIYFYFTNSEAMLVNLKMCFREYADSKGPDLTALPRTGRAFTIR